MTEPRLISTAGKTSSNTQHFSLGDEVWLTDEALLLVRRKGANLRTLIGMAIALTLTLVGVQVAGFLGAFLLGALGGFVYWLLAAHGREDPGKSQAAWGQYLRLNPPLLTMNLTKVAAARFKDGRSVRLELVDEDGFVTTLSWQRNPKTNALIRDALRGTLQR